MNGASDKETEGLIVPKESIGAPRVIVVVNKDNPWRFEDINSLRSIRLGVVDGYSYR